MQIAIPDETSEPLIHDVLQELQDPPERQVCAPKRQLLSNMHLPQPSTSTLENAMTLYCLYLS